MERVNYKLVLLLLVLVLSLHYLRVVGSHGSLSVSNKLKGGIRCSMEEREALLNFKQSLSYPSLFLSNWIKGEDCCTWKGVGCSNTTGHVTKLNLSWRFCDLPHQITGTSLVPSLFLLKHLQYLSLSCIYFKNQASIPPSIASLSNLRHLDLSWSNFVGEIPPHLGNLTKLRYLDLHFNDVVIDMSLDMWLFRLKHLQYLSLGYVRFKQTNILQNFTSFTALRYLDLSRSGLEGEIPPQLGNLTNLYLLGLDDNNLVASSLLWMSQLSSLKYLYMFNVNLTLVVNWLYEINLLPALSILVLSNCNLQTLPTSSHTYFNFSSTITDIDLPENQLNGSLLISLCNLNYLNLAMNNLIELIDHGSILSCDEYKMKWIDISYNQLSGSIPQWVGEMRHLESLDLSNNLFDGSVSDANFANLSNLNFLDLSYNYHLDFNKISFNWIPPFQLSNLYLISCSIGPRFPLWIQNQKSIFYLDLSNNSINDIIPSWFSNISHQIFYLNLSHNTIRGELPVLLNIGQVNTIDLNSNLLEGHLPYPNNSMQYADFSNNKFSSGIEWYLNANMSSLSILNLSQNNIFGKISSSICQMPSIFILDLSYNNLFGEIPKCKRDISLNLEFISLKNNKFWGSIPAWMGNLGMLVSLYLSNNNFYEEIPFFKNSSYLITLDLGQNKLTGTIPLWIGDRLVSLKILSLRSNKLHGSIPVQLSKLEGLQILDLADNFLTGSLSARSFKFLKAMNIPNRRLAPQYDSWTDSLMIDMKGQVFEYKDILFLVMTIDLSCNNLTGEVPMELMSLTGLISLNLSRNQFTGQIPKNIGVMQSLESLDLSSNYFSGEIPASIVNLNGLDYLNFSYNKLSGRIPLGTQLDTFNASSYYGNPELCGKPLQKTCEGDDQGIDNEKGNSNVDDNDNNFGLFLSMGLGFAVGLWSVLGTLLLNKSLANAYFQLCDNITNNIYVFVAIRVNRFLNR